FGLRRIAVQQFYVVRTFVDAIAAHAPENATLDGRYFVIDKIDPAHALEQAEHILHETVFAVKHTGGRLLARWLPLNANEFLSDAIGRKDIVDDARSHGTVGHAVVFRFGQGQR